MMSRGSARPLSIAAPSAKAGWWAQSSLIQKSAASQSSVTGNVSKPRKDGKCGERTVGSQEYFLVSSRFSVKAIGQCIDLQFVSDKRGVFRKMRGHPFHPISNDWVLCRAQIFFQTEHVAKYQLREDSEI